MPWAPESHSSREWKKRNRKGEVKPRTKAMGIRSTGRWQSFRRMLLRRNPLCMDPFGHHDGMGLSAMATQVHHIVGVEENPRLAFCSENCAPLCSKCHGLVEGMIKRGDDTMRLWEGRRLRPMTEWRDH